MRTYARSLRLSARSRFGECSAGKGVYFQSVIIAIVFGDELRLKADSISAPEFEAGWFDAVGLRRPPWRSHDALLVDPGTRPSMIQTQWGNWVRLAFDAGDCGRKPSRQW